MKERGVVADFVWMTTELFFAIIPIETNKQPSLAERLSEKSKIVIAYHTKGLYCRRNKRIVRPGVVPKFWYKFCRRLLERLKLTFRRSCQKLARLLLRQNFT